jgi:hypothetical protein
MPSREELLQTDPLAANPSIAVISENKRQAVNYANTPSGRLALSTFKDFFHFSDISSADERLETDKSLSEPGNGD